jgi:hypothetical protein
MLISVGLELAKSRGWLEMHEFFSRRGGGLACSHERVSSGSIVRRAARARRPN